MLGLNLTFMAMPKHADIILIYGERKLSGLLLWDSVNSNIVFAAESFMDF